MTDRCRPVQQQTEGLVSQHHPEWMEHALRLRVPDARLAFNDAVTGQFEQNLQKDVGDFVIRRRDGLFACQLAVVVDDTWQGVTHIVRGADLLDATPRQIYLQQCLHYPQSEYLHLPLAGNAARKF